MSGSKIAEHIHDDTSGAGKVKVPGAAYAAGAQVTIRQNLFRFAGEAA